jgi:gamma-glutamylcyclotransferase (GGCT)/AIG2-like uncharacterized protein YtfP
MLVAVYGTLRQGFINNDILENSEYLGEDILDGFLMFDLGYFPGVIRYGDDSIVVEIYDVDKNTLSDLDFLEGKDRMYNRELVDTSYGPSYIYTIMNPWGEVISGDWKEYKCSDVSVSAQLK